METTPRLQLPYILPSQAQKHVTHNEALRLIDGLVQPVVGARGLAGPPASPAEGDTYVAAPGATGEWAGRDNAIACFADGAWHFLAPATGWQAYDAGAGERIVFDGTAWAAADAGGARLARFGVHTEADATDRLAVSSPASLFTHEGSDHRLKINKASEGDTASQLFQSSSSGRAELGLTGDDDFHLKVSADGSGWIEALVAARDTGAVRFPGGVVHPASGRPVAQLLPCPTVGHIWQIDAARPATPRSYTLASAGGSELTLTEARVPEIFTDAMRNAAMVRIWNTGKSPAEPAWVTWNAGESRLSVNDAADIAGWSPGDTLRLGDPNPTGTNTLGMVAIDISPFLQSVFGAVFRQRGVLLASCASGASGDTRVDGSGDGTAGSETGAASAPDGTVRWGEQTLFTDQPSPVSNSNLVFVGESLGLGRELNAVEMRVRGLYV